MISETILVTHANDVRQHANSASDTLEQRMRTMRELGTHANEQRRRPVRRCANDVNDSEGVGYGENVATRVNARVARQQRGCTQWQMSNGGGYGHSASVEAELAHREHRR